ncbi:double-strand break repair helicase AddA [Lichenihabitans sp. PAMC28606]|uniref:double-strand break repair helicase AddA n=1 Tax=Lichenihabitans sp. PAMC28606 TaxID=2880932 RepID=UPI001D0ACC03|nr:double-strand break repair helicase AddA [Lichenihabitans sp. PAMC28606]UDL96040.1 double-strand break repair helicase AddA [Lichenihabitans sp. PAMC28606]
MSQNIPVDTIVNQQRASDPTGSAWVSANAGSGKTFVLTRRVIRLLLGGVAPSRILCLTFTKAAAANMSIRVFDTLARWVTMDDAALSAAMIETGAPRPTPADLAAARRLFARTVETPGGLKILTIHAFCEKMLHAFPFEANVAARFTVIEATQQAELLSRAREAALAEAVDDPDSPLGQAVERLGRTLSTAVFDGLVAEVSTHYGSLRASLQAAGGIDRLGDALGQALGTGGLGIADVERAMLDDGLQRSEWESIGQHLASLGSATGERLIEAARATGPGVIAAYLDVFLTQKLGKRADSYLAKKVRAAEASLCATLDAERDRLVDLLAKRRAAEAFEGTMALLTVAGAILDTYEGLKRRRGLLDFSDLIERSRMLLQRSDSAWVLYKLDSGIDHVLVDEAQDTSPDQWDILRAISRDFFSGEGQSRSNRTFFAVGDAKQSIYSFQGARPAMFDAAHQDYKKRAIAAGLRFESVRLQLSFRSARTVLDVVDRIFAHEGHARGLSAGADGVMPHEALKRAIPGLVELWRPIGPTPAPEPADWRLPVDLPDASDPAVVMARRVADTIARLTAPGSTETVHDGPSDRRRSVHPGDILILVRSRGPFFNAVIRALKDKRVPVAGADRVNLTDHIAVMDLTAAGRAALLPDDDLTLACALKSPLMGFDDDDLLRLAPQRGGSLAEAIAASTNDRDRTAANWLSIWRDRAATLTPFAFYTRLLGQDGGRRKLLSRLGPEAGDVIDEFMALTLAHERDGAPSLLTFLARLEGTELSVKRDMDAAGDAVRVMTVHAAKGLEAKIVFLPDTCGVPRKQHDPKLFWLDGERLDGEQSSESRPGLLVWSPKSDADTPAVADRRLAGWEATLDEHRRLLYVALTRAEERLYIGGFHGKNDPAADSWYKMIEAVDLGLEPVPAPWDANDTILRRSDPMGEATMAVAAPAGLPVEAPAWLNCPAPREVAVAPPIRPSNALGAADQPPRDASDLAIGPRPTAQREAALVGRLMHRLLQHLPAVATPRRRDAGLRYLAAQGRALTAEKRDQLVTTALRVLDEPALLPLFGPGSQAEVAIAARVDVAGHEVDVTGQIDRIALTDDAIWIGDYKTGAAPRGGTVPSSYMVQLALYRSAVSPLYPGRVVRAFLIWTEGPLVMELASGDLDAALSTLGPR